MEDPVASSADLGARAVGRGWQPAPAAGIVGAARVASPTIDRRSDPGIEGRWHHVGALVIADRRGRRPTPRCHAVALEPAR